MSPSEEDTPTMCQDRFDPRRFRLLGALTEPQVLMIQRAARFARVPRRHRIYRCGDSSDHVFFLQAGVVKIATLLPGGRETPLTFLYPGDVFGELTLIEDGPRDHLADAHEDAVVWAVDRRAFLDILNRSPALESELTRLMARRARSLRTRLEELLCKDAHARVARTLLNLAAEHSVSDAEGLLIPIRLTQADLANMTGLARETINGVFCDLRASGLIEVSRHNIRISRPNALRSADAMPRLFSRQKDDHAFHTHRFTRRNTLAANVRRMVGDARDASDDGAGRSAVGARSHRL